MSFDILTIRKENNNKIYAGVSSSCFPSLPNELGTIKDPDTRWVFDGVVLDQVGDNCAIYVDCTDPQFPLRVWKRKGGFPGDANYDEWVEPFVPEEVGDDLYESIAEDLQYYMEHHPRPTLGELASVIRPFDEAGNRLGWSSEYGDYFITPEGVIYEGTPDDRGEEIESLLVH